MTGSRRRDGAPRVDRALRGRSVISFRGESVRRGCSALAHGDHFGAGQQRWRATGERATLPRDAGVRSKLMRAACVPAKSPGRQRRLTSRRPRPSPTRGHATTRRLDPVRRARPGSPPRCQTPR